MNIVHHKKDDYGRYMFFKHLGVCVEKNDERNVHLYTF